MKELEVISKTVKIENSDEKIFKFFSDFRNLSQLIPPDVKEWNADENTCTFSVKGQTVSIKIIEKEAFKHIKISSDESSKMPFNLWIQLKRLDTYQTAVRIVVRTELNMIMRATVKKPLKQGLDQIADYLKLLPY